MRRTILWIIFAVSLFYIWDSWQHQHGGDSLLFGAAPVPQIAQGTPGSDVPSASVGSASGAAASTAPLPTLAGATPPSTAIEHVTLRTDLYLLDISTLGAQIDRLELLKYRDTDDATKNMILLDDRADHTYVAQSGLTGDGFPNHHSVFTRQPGPTVLAPGQDHLDVTFVAESGGVRLTKTYTLRPDSYEIGVRHEIANLSEKAIMPQLYLQLVRDDTKPKGSMRFYSPYYGAAEYTAAEKFQTISFEDMTKRKDRAEPRQATDGWIAILQHYFVAAWIPKAGVDRTYRTETVPDSKTFRAAALIPISVAAGASATDDATLYIGPEENSILEKVAPGFPLVRNYGWSTVLARPVFWLLTTLHGYFGNWGWAIIVLTFLIKLVFFPLSAASYRSMARMKNVAPKMKLVQEKFKEDRLKMNQAMMELYKTEKVNPAGGCLPILIQIPVFIALYSSLSASVEMRGAPWIGWIHDLAAPDPWFILPAIMTASMFIQYKLNPAPPDPTQAKMMMIMPLVFGVMFFFFPAGLVLYQVVNNLLSIAQQYYITRILNKGSVPAKA